MNLNLQDQMQLCKSLMDCGLGLSEAANVLIDLESGKSFASSLKNVFSNRKKNFEEVNEKYVHSDWGWPITY